jgi:hypothetical protein
VFEELVNAPPQLKSALGVRSHVFGTSVPPPNLTRRPQAAFA